ncbi:MAG: hypothetical protein HYT12_04665 [Candidatus Liptonbacteria bacterium]|nr:hypothetical protein [Candidatus Liptonbacteria bacterium]
MRETEPNIPQEYIHERPAVFTDAETDGLVRGFATRYLELKKPIEAGREPASLGDIVLDIEQVISRRVSAELAGRLKSGGYTEEQTRAIVDAAAKRDFSAVEQLGEKETLSALGLGLTAEKARTALVADAIQGLDSSSLRRFGMTPEQRDIVVQLIKGLESADPEYVRFKARAMRGEKYPKRPTDALRESARVNRGLKQACETLEKQGTGKVFGEAGKDFLEYLGTLEASYRPLTQDGRAKGLGSHTRDAKEAWVAFQKFVGMHPDFPLIVLPKSDSYVKSEAENLGWDPEIRIFWQSPNQREKSRELQSACQRFVSSIQDNLPDHAEPSTMEQIAGIRPIVCDDIGSYGVNMTFRAEAQEFEKARAFVLIENRGRSERLDQARENIWGAFGHEWDDIINSPEFFNLMQAQLMNHELGHNLYGEESKEVLGLGRQAYDSIDEHKADLLAVATLHDVVRESSKQAFGERGEEAINLAIIADALTCSRQAPHGELDFYRVSAINILHRLEQNGVFENGSEGIGLNKEKLHENWSKKVFISQARELLDTYKLAGSELTSEVRRSRSFAKKIAGVEPDALLQKLIARMKNRAQRDY